VNIRFYIDPETGLPHIYSVVSKKDPTCNKPETARQDRNVRRRNRSNREDDYGYAYRGTSEHR
jgi:hypothetical protein